MPELDPRLTPARPDLAAEHLRGQVEAERFVEPVDWQCHIPASPIRRSPSPTGAMDDQVLCGEVFAVLEEVDGWAWGFSRADGYVGWVDLSGFTHVVLPVKRRISVLRTYAFSEPDFKKAPECLLSLNAVIDTGRREGRFLEAKGLGWVVEEHTCALDEHATDFVAVAEAFLGSPYLWGGKESLGLDCSGLVQMALRAAGLDVPRDTDQQEAVLKAAFPDVTTDPERQRGDVVFWPGHVGIMTDSEHLLHANANSMDTTLEVFAEAEARIQAAENPVRTIVRVPLSPASG
ncbi:C40 family peptidase [Maricaulis parjimensis]|uniref:C40 family peptidase n=1 Tax=Maricaulis parjimensis TaxID=144023 RepID=UPI00193A5BC3|nr:NlpC/P60 family protein [Maricaulis parjimensis]